MWRPFTQGVKKSTARMSSGELSRKEHANTTQQAVELVTQHD